MRATIVMHIQRVDSYGPNTPSRYLANAFRDATPAPFGGLNNPDWGACRNWRK